MSSTKQSKRLPREIFGPRIIDLGVVFEMTGGGVVCWGDGRLLLAGGRAGKQARVRGARSREPTKNLHFWTFGTLS